MRQLSAAVLAATCFVSGYLVAGTRASAEDIAVRTLPVMIRPGDRVTLSFAAGSMGTGNSDVDCRISATSGIWVRCGGGDAFDNGRDQVWYDLTRVAVVRKTDK